MPRRSHGEVKSINGKRVATPEYRVWQLMKNRCNNPRAHDWKYYGGRGVFMDPRWHKFEVFLAEMGRRPTPLHTLDRRNNNGGYWKGNCRWATRADQARNRNYCRLDFQKAEEIRQAYATGVFQHVLAKQYGVTQATISQVTRGRTWREIGGAS